MTTMMQGRPAGQSPHVQALPGQDKPPPAQTRHPFLIALGERVRAWRARRGLTRKALAAAAEVSERHLANLEYGQGNASILVLLQIANALQCPLAALLADANDPVASGQRSAWAHASNAGAGASAGAAAAAGVIGTGARATEDGPGLRSRIALIGLRGGGKSSLGRMLAEDLGFPFVELSRSIETLAGCSMAEIQGLYGMNAYRRYERRALEDTLRAHDQVVIATPGGIVSEPDTLALLLAHCLTVWLKAAPSDHMARVVAQGDLRPMAERAEAMADLKGILEGRAPFYARADVHVDTSAAPLGPTFMTLRQRVRTLLQRPD